MLVQRIALAYAAGRQAGRNSVAVSGTMLAPNPPHPASLSVCARWIFENSVQNTVVVSRLFYTQEVRLGLGRVWHRVEGLQPGVGMGGG